MNPFAKTKTLAGILSTFSKTLSELEALAIRNDEQADANDSVIRDLEAESTALEAEADAARKAAGRIRELIG